jgi:hypothetical protein
MTRLNAVRLPQTSHYPTFVIVSSEVHIFAAEIEIEEVAFDGVDLVWLAEARRLSTFLSYLVSASEDSDVGIKSARRKLKTVVFTGSPYLRR